METVTLKITGMTCGGCVNSVRRVVTGLSGVNTVDVSLERAEATISFDPAQSNATDFKNAIRDAGFETD
jgi:copper chaperone